MRPLEISLAVSCLLLLSVSFLRLPRSIRDFGFLAGMLLMFVQISLEGYRFQLLPLYGLFLGSLVMLRFGKDIPRVTFLRVSTNVLLWLASIALPLLLPVFDLGKPTGPYPVGTMQYEWTDRNREERLTSDPADRRRLVVQLWYPSEAPAGDEARTASYVPEAQDLGKLLWQKYHIPATLTNYLHYIKTSSYEQAPVSRKQFSYPVILYSHGLPGTRYSSTRQMEELASQGFIVAAVQHTFYAWTTVFSDGTTVGQTKNKPAWTDLSGWDQVIAEWVMDDRFVLDQLTELNRAEETGILRGKLNLNAVGIAGHSFGGAAAVKALQEDARFKAAANMDGTPFGSRYEGGLPRPVLYMNTGGLSTETVAEPTEEQLASQGLTREAYERFMKEIPLRTRNMVSGGGYSVTLQGLKHMSFTDYYLWSPVLRHMDRLPEAPDESQAKIEELLLQFFNKTLHGIPAPVLDGTEAPQPGIVIQRISS